MSLDVRELLMSPTTWLWLVVSAIAALLLFASINRRRSRLTESLRDYVDRHQGSEHSHEADEATKAD